jgi:hypothetical protein
MTSASTEAVDGVGCVKDVIGVGVVCEICGIKSCTGFGLYRNSVLRSNNELSDRSFCSGTVCVVLGAVVSGVDDPALRFIRKDIYLFIEGF